MHSPRHTDPRQKLRDARSDCERHEEQLESALGIRRAFILDAAKAEIPKTEIAELAGVSRQTVYDILGA